MIPRKSPGNNRYEWTIERLHTLRHLLAKRKRPTEIASLMQCYDVQCIYYGRRMLEKIDREAEAA